MMMKKTSNTNEVSFNNINKDNIQMFNNKNRIVSVDKYSYIKIDSNNIFKKISPQETKIINEKIKKFIVKKNKINELSKTEYINEIIKKFLEKYYTKNEINPKKIISLISNLIKSKKKLNRDTMEDYINFFYNSRDLFKSSSNLILTKKLFRNIGIVLSYAYSKLSEYPIDPNGIKDYVNQIITKKINVLTDYFLYCNQCGNDPMLMKKTYEWRKLVKINNYKIPPELIFLVNIFQSCLKLEINIEFNEDILNEEDLHLLTITLLNIEYVFPSLENISLNLIHNKLQQIFNERYFNRITNLADNQDETLKKNFSKDIVSLYETKWDFVHEFNLIYYNELKKISERNKKKISLDEYCIISNNEEKDRELILKKTNISTLNTSSTFEISSFDKNNKIDDIGFIDLEWDELDKNIPFNKINQSSVKNKENIKETNEGKKIQYMKLLEKNYLIFDFIIMTLCCLSWNKSVRKITVLSNDYYTSDLINYLKVFFDLEIERGFHLFHILYNKINGYDLLNFEFNALDIFTFKKMIEIIYVNITLISLNISFFSSDVSYLLGNLYKVYSEQIKTQKNINEYLAKKGKNFNMEEFENKILDDICPFFIEHLAMLFEIIKNKNDLKELGINFDIPDILINNNKYKITIYKFILNIIMLINNKESKHSSSIKKLTLLSPKIIFSNKLETNIDSFFQNLSLYYNSKTIINLNLEFQFYKISNIKTIISPNLFTLSIGDLDLFSLDNLVNYLTSYNFSSQSNLSHLSIKLIGAITNFNTQIKMIFQRLFNLNLKNLLKLNLFTNIIIDKKTNYLFLIKILSYNWIPSYVITLNEKSKKAVGYFNIFGMKKIPFLVSESIQNLVFKEVGYFHMRRNNFHGNEIYWILKFLLFRKYRENKTYLAYSEIQYLIFVILKYLYLISNIKLEHECKIETNKGKNK